MFLHSAVYVHILYLQLHIFGGYYGSIEGVQRELDIVGNYIIT